MTALSTTRTTSRSSSDSLLRLAMRVDAVLSGLCGITLALMAGPSSSLTGYPASVMYALGGGFVGYAVAVFAGAGLARVRTAGIATMVANLLFTVAAVITVLDVELTTAGVVATLAVGVYTLVFADLQYLGARRIKE